VETFFLDIDKNKKNKHTQVNWRFERLLKVSLSTILHIKHRGKNGNTIEGV
jgi:hypothetical protein